MRGGGGETLLHGGTAGLRYGAAVHWETGRGARELTDMASNEAIHHMAHLRNLVIAEGMCPSIRTIGVIFDFPRRAADYLLREVGIRLQPVVQGRVLTGGFEDAGLKAGFWRGCEHEHEHEASA